MIRELQEDSIRILDRYLLDNGWQLGIRAKMRRAKQLLVQYLHGLRCGCTLETQAPGQWKSMRPMLVSF